MSFLSILKTIGHGIATGVGDVAPFAPIIGAIPVLGPVATTALGAVVSVENLVSTSGTGAQKKQAVTSIVNAVHPGLDQNNLSEAIDGIVAGFNLIEQAIGKIPATAQTKPAPPAGQ